MNTFTPSRPDGRSDRRIVYELVQDAEPETLFDYAQITEALQDGIDLPIRRDRVYRAVAAGNRTLQRERKRTLAPVPGRGYRIARADEHLSLAVVRKAKAETQLKAGIDLLRNVRLDELSEPHRTLHVGQLMILDGVYRMAHASQQRIERQEQVIAGIRQQQADIAARLDKIEGADVAQ